MAFPGLQHVAITVTDLERSTRWYSALFGAEPVLDEDEEGGRFHHTVFALDGGMLFGLHSHQGRESGDPATEERTGLDHISFAVGSTAELEQWASKLDFDQLLPVDAQFMKDNRDEKILKKAEYKLLSEGYLFLRRLDHRLRLERDQSIDSFEADPGRLEGIARALGYGERNKKTSRTHSQSGTKLLRDYQSRREKIRACYERYFITNPNA